MVWAVLAVGFHVLGIVSAISAVLHVRTAQGAIAWTVALVTLPYVTVPLWWVFGRRRFAGYYERWADRRDRVDELVRPARADAAAHAVHVERRIPDYEALKALAAWPLTQGNDIDLLVDGEPTFADIAAGIDRAKLYVLVEFFIVRDDGLGRRLKDRLIAAAARGVKVHFLYDEIGSKGLSRAYVRELRAAGVSTWPFGTRRGWSNFFQLNFRNHRKIVVVDGLEAWIGGTTSATNTSASTGRSARGATPTCASPGPPSSGRRPRSSSTGAGPPATSSTSTGLRSRAPPTARRSCSRPGLRTGSRSQARSSPTSSTPRANASGSRRPTSSPSRRLVSALPRRAPRVDVRVLVPANNDKELVRYASYYCTEDLAGMGIKFLAFRDGFMHQKVMLVDDALATIGTHNFDNRSFLLNFEISAVVHDAEFCHRVAAMLEADFARADPIDPTSFAKRPLWFRFAMRAARLTAPIQ
jgi:cardiolipin synthase